MARLESPEIIIGEVGDISDATFWSQRGIPVWRVDVPYVRMGEGCLTWVRSSICAGAFSYEFDMELHCYVFHFTDRDSAFAFKIRWR